MIGAALGLLLVWALFVPSIDPWSQRLVIDPRPSVMAVALVALLAVLALTGRRIGRGARVTLAALLLTAALLQFVAATVSGLLDRPLDLYFDLPQVPSLVEIFTQALGPWRAAGAAALAVLGALALVAAIAAAIAACEQALARRGATIAALGACAVALAIGILPRGDEALSFAATDALADQGARLVHAAAVMNGLDHRYDAALAAPVPQGDLAALAGRDVFLVFVESYGTVALDDPAYRAVVAPALQDFAAAAQAAGYGIRSSRLVSPVFGAGSWLAHGTVSSGLKLDPFLDRLLVESGRPTLGRLFGAAGHRVVAMARHQEAVAGSRFWGSPRIISPRATPATGRNSLISGIPDQYTLARFDPPSARNSPGHARRFSPRSCSCRATRHCPGPALSHGVESATGAIPPCPQRCDEPRHLDRPYLDSAAYDFATLGGWALTFAGGRARHHPGRSPAAGPRVGRDRALDGADPCPVARPRAPHAPFAEMAIWMG